MRWIVAMLLAAAVAGCVEEPAQDWDALDDDGDGVPNGAERRSGTDPADPQSFPQHANSSIVLPQWGQASSPIRPGAPIGWCTYNFLFFAPENGTYYIGTAAHCTDGPGQRMPLAGFKDEIGTVVYDSDNVTQGANADFSLIELDEGLNLDAYPAMMNLQGPVGHTNATEVEVGDILEHHGYGMVFGNYEQTRDRQGVFSGWSGGPGHDYCAESPIWWGDSGSPILHQDTQTAFGIVSRAGWVNCVPAAQLMGASMQYIFEELGEHGWDGVELATI